MAAIKNTRMHFGNFLWCRKSQYKDAGIVPSLIFHEELIIISLIGLWSCSFNKN